MMYNLNLTAVMDTVCNDSETIIITSPKQRVVMMSLDDYNALIVDILKTPYSGLGKPEQLRYELTGFWSRRISGEHRLVYRVVEDEVQIISCRFHYQ